MIYVTSSANEDIKKFYDFLNHEPYGVTEIRIIKKGKIYKIGSLIIKRILLKLACQKLVMVTFMQVLNPCPSKFLNKAPNKLKRMGTALKSTDTEYIRWCKIICVNFLPVIK